MLHFSEVCMNDELLLETQPFTPAQGSRWSEHRFEGWGGMKIAPASKL